MVGWDQVYLDSVVYTDPNQVKRFGDTCVEFPVLRGHDLRSTGSCGAHALSVGIIEIADDGQSGRSFYVTPGTMFGNYNAMGRREPRPKRRMVLGALRFGLCLSGRALAVYP